jgi:hypothetical protein
MSVEETIQKLELFKGSIRSFSALLPLPFENTSLRTLINQNKTWVRQEIIDTGCFKYFGLTPSKKPDGIAKRGKIDAFDMIFNQHYGAKFIPFIADMIDETIGTLRFRAKIKTGLIENTVMTKLNISKNFAFVAMAIDPQNPELEDVLDAIKEGAIRCGIKAERIDETQSNERITDRILESIRKAEFVIVDLTLSKPNVFYEAGYAHGIGKIPVYVAKNGTKLEFDLKDYPVIVFSNYKHLKDELEKRLRALLDPISA